MKADEVMIRPPFPNPVNQNEEPTFNLALPEATSNWKVRVDLYHASGGAADQYTTELQAGIQELKLKLREDMMPGLYFYTVRVYSGSSQKFFTGKIIIGKR